MFFVVGEFVIILLDRELFVHFFLVLGFSLRYTVMALVFVFFLTPSQIYYRLATLPDNGHVYRNLAPIFIRPEHTFDSAKHALTLLFALRRLHVVGRTWISTIQLTGPLLVFFIINDVSHCII